MFPHVGFFRKGGYPAFSEVMKEIEPSCRTNRTIRKSLNENPHLCIKVFKVLEKKLLIYRNGLEAQILNNTYEQIIKLLLGLEKEHGKDLENGTISYLKSEFTNRDLGKHDWDNKRNSQPDSDQNKKDI